MKKTDFIQKVEAYEVVVPAKEGTVNSECYRDDLRWDLMPICLVIVTTREGLTGLGETTRGVSLDQIKSWLRQLPGLEVSGWSLASLPAHWRGATLWGLYERHAPPLWRSVSPLVPALEMAFLDLAGKRLGCRAVDLLGGAYTERVPVHYWCARQTPEDLERTVRKARSLGFRGIKTKSKRGDPVLEQVSAIKSAGGRDFHITLDPMGQWCAPLDFLHILRGLESLGEAIEVEDPFPQDMPEFWHRARSASSVPLMFHARSLEILRGALAARCADGFNCAGGIMGFITCAHAVEVAGYSCWHGSAIELGVGQIAHLHAAAAARSCVLSSDFVSGIVREHTLIRWDWPYRDGMLPLPSGTGLGIELDCDALEKYVKEKTAFSC